VAVADDLELNETLKRPIEVEVSSKQKTIRYRPPWVKRLPFLFRIRKTKNLQLNNEMQSRLIQKKISFKVYSTNS